MRLAACILVLLAVVACAHPAPAATIAFTSPAPATYRWTVGDPPNQPDPTYVAVTGTWDYTTEHSAYRYAIWKTPPGLNWGSATYINTETSTRPANAEWATLPDWLITYQEGTFVWLAITQYRDGGVWQEGDRDVVTTYVEPEP